MNNFLSEAAEVLRRLNTADIDRAIELLVETRKRHGRPFILSIGGGAANASHAVNDFAQDYGFRGLRPNR